MEFSLAQIIRSLGLTEVIILSIVGVILVLICVSRRINILLFILVLSAALVGSAIPLVDSVAALIRWLSLFLLLIVIVFRWKFTVSVGLLPFWGYVLLGLVFLLDAVYLDWQLQRALLLLMVAVVIPFAYDDENYKSIELSLLSIAVAATVYSVLNFVSLPTHLIEGARFSGYSQGAASFAMVLGGFLPFTFWGLWRADNRVVRIACGSGFLFGLITLVFTGQRAGALGGMIGLIPLLIISTRQKNIGRSAFVVALVFLLGYILLQHSSGELTNFLSSRYSVEHGLSGRESIWREAFLEIGKNPLFGRGIGASETVIGSSFHNSYLEIWFNTGFVGLLLFFTSQIYFLYRIIYLRRRSKDPGTRSILALALGYMMGFVAMCIFESPAAGASNLNLILYLFLGGIVSNKHLTNYAQPSDSQYPIPYH